MEPTAFSRVTALLRYARTARWTAAAAAVTTGVVYALFVLLLALFADLLVTRGRIPHFAQLTVREQEAFQRQWVESISEDDRGRAVRHVGFSDFEVSPAQPDALPAEPKSRWRAYQGLVAASDSPLPPPPGTATQEALVEWAAKRQIAGDPYYAAAVENEWRWRAFVWLYLNDRVGARAADTWQPAVEPGYAVAPPGLGEENRRPYGILGLVVHQRNTPLGRATATFATVAPWAWNREDPNGAYLTGLLIIALGLIVVRGMATIVMKDAAERTALEAVTRLRRSIYHHAARQGAMTISTGAVEEAGGLFTRQVQEVHDALVQRLTNGYRYPVKFGLMLGIALITHVWLTLAFVVFSLIVWSLAGQMSGSFRRQSKAASRVAGNRLELLLESLRLIRLVKSYLMEVFNQSRVERQLTEYARAHLRRTRGDAMARPLLIAFAAMSGVTLLYLAGRVILNDGLSVAGLVVLAVAFVSLYQPVRARLMHRRVARHGHEAAAAIFEFLDRKGDVAAYPDAEFLGSVAKSLEFIDVSVREPGTGRMLLNRVSFKVKAGQKIGVVASDVEEQLALVSLVPRFLDPTEGEIKVDGRPLKWVTQDSLRAQVGVVLQNSLVFNDTVGNNIGCGDPSYSLPQIVEAAKLAHAHQFIQRLPYGYETPIGDLGHSLSAGEKFRIAIARAVLRDPTLYIIEEPSDPMDEDTKDLVDDTLSRVLPDKTVIYLPHRMSTLRECDCIYLLHDGAFVAAGEHADLIGQSELYRHLYYLEFNPFADHVAG